MPDSVSCFSRPGDCCPVNSNPALSSLVAFELRGTFQKRVYFLVCLPAVYCALNSFTWTFTGAELPFRCRLGPTDSDFHRPPPLFNVSLAQLLQDSCRRPLLSADGPTVHTQTCLDGYLWDNSVRQPTALQEVLLHSFPVQQ